MSNASKILGCHQNRHRGGIFQWGALVLVTTRGVLSLPVVTRRQENKGTQKSRTPFTLEAFFRRFIAKNLINASSAVPVRKLEGFHTVGTGGVTGFTTTLI